MLKYGCILMQNCPCLYFNEGNENFLLLLPFTSCASWNERGDPTAPEFNVTKDNCHQAAWVWRCPLCSYTQLTFPAESGFSIHVLQSCFVLLEEISLLPLQHSSSSVIIPTMKFIKITASLLISKFFPNFLLGVLGA